MTNEEAIAIIRNEYKCVDRDCDIERSCGNCSLMMPSKEPILEAYKLAIKALEQQPCEMTTEEYRQRMIQAFHNADTDELIAVCVLPTEKEFEHLEWLLKNHYKKEPCDDAISRQAVLDINFKRIILTTAKPAETIEQKVKALPSVTQKYGKWIHIGGDEWICSKCGEVITTEGSWDKPTDKYCKECGAKMQESEVK